MVVTYKWIEVQSYNFCHCTRHEQENGSLGKFFLYSSFFTAIKNKIHEEKSIAYDCFDVDKCPDLTYPATKRTFLNSWRWCPDFYYYTLLQETFKKFTEFFSAIHKYVPNVFIALYCKFRLVQNNMSCFCRSGHN